MSDPLVSSSSQSWTERIGAAVKGMAVGGGLFLAAFPLLTWNEGRAVKTARALDEGAGATIAADAGVISPGHEGKPVHLTGTAKTAATLADETFGVSAPGALRLKREVQMYQWRETTERKTEKKTGGARETTATTTYEKVWSGTPIDSTQFKQQDGHANPATLPFRDESKQADLVTVGARKLTAAQIATLPATTPVAPASADALKLPAELRAKAIVQPDGVYLGKNPAAAEIGDVRVAFHAATETPVSLVAAQKGDSFAPYRTGDGRTIDMLKIGTHGPGQLFEQAQSTNTMWTWVLRLAGILVMTIGITLLLSPLAVIADGVPVIGNFVEAGLGLLAVFLGFGLSLVTIALAWIAYRPLLGLALLLLAAAAGYGIHRLRTRKTADRPLAA